MNKRQHAMGAALAVGTSALLLNANTDKTPEQRAVEALGSAALAGALGSIPDWLEPATNPHHRQFFHSVTALSLLVGGLHKVYRWQPQEPHHELLKTVALIGGGAYLVHLLMDATTPKSLPLIGKLPI